MEIVIYSREKSYENICFIYIIRMQGGREEMIG